MVPSVPSVPARSSPFYLFLPFYKKKNSRSILFEAFLYLRSQLDDLRASDCFFRRRFEFQISEKHLERRMKGVVVVRHFRFSKVATKASVVVFWFAKQKRNSFPTSMTALARRANRARVEAARAAKEARALSAIQLQRAWRERETRETHPSLSSMLSASGSTPIELFDWYIQEKSEDRRRSFIVATRARDNTIIQTSRVVREWFGAEGHHVLTSSNSLYKLL